MHVKFTKFYNVLRYVFQVKFALPKDISIATLKITVNYHHGFMAGFTGSDITFVN